MVYAQRASRGRWTSLALTVLMLTASATAQAEADQTTRAYPLPTNDPVTLRTSTTSQLPIEIVGVVLALAAVGVGASLVLHRRARGTENSVGLRVLGRTPLGPRHAIYMVQLGKRTLLVGVGGQGPPNVLGDLTDDNEFIQGAIGGSS